MESQKKYIPKFRFDPGLKRMRQALEILRYCNCA